MTSTWRSRAELAHQVTLLAKQGESRRAIARTVGVSRNISMSTMPDRFRTWLEHDG